MAGPAATTRRVEDVQGGRFATARPRQGKRRRSSPRHFRRPVPHEANPPTQVSKSVSEHKWARGESSRRARSRTAAKRGMRKTRDNSRPVTCLCNAIDKGGCQW